MDEEGRLKIWHPGKGTACLHGDVPRKGHTSAGVIPTEILQISEYFSVYAIYAFQTRQRGVHDGFKVTLLH